MIVSMLKIIFSFRVLHYIRKSLKLRGSEVIILTEHSPDVAYFNGFLKINNFEFININLIIKFIR